MAFTSTLMTSDKRDQNIDTFPVWERKIVFTIDAGDGSAKTAQAVEMNGIVKSITATSGAATGITGTFTLSIDDNDNNEVFTAATPETPAETATSVFNVDIPLSGIIDVNIDPNDDPTSGSWEITIVLRGV